MSTWRVPPRNRAETREYTDLGRDVLSESRPFRRGPKRGHVAGLVCFRIDGAIQPVRITADANHCFTDRDLIPWHRRDQLWLGFAYPVGDSEATVNYPALLAPSALRRSVTL